MQCIRIEGLLSLDLVNNRNGNSFLTFSVIANNNAVLCQNNDIQSTEKSEILSHDGLYKICGIFKY